jgi:hypothetical protein
MNIDQRDIDRFEKHLNPAEPDNSGIPFKILGYGEISSIFQMEKYPEVAFKRLPVFPDRQSAQRYRDQYFAYASHLKEAGIRLPDEDLFITRHSPGRPHVLYLAQALFEKECFCNQLIHTLDQDRIAGMLEEIIQALHTVWRYNESAMPGIEIALDAQLSNWVWPIENGKRNLYLIDTSTPFLRIKGKEQLDVKLLLRSIPFIIRLFIRFINLDDVVARYYDRRIVFLDIIGNLVKEQVPELIPFFVDHVNKALENTFDLNPISRSEVDAYYQKDKLIWTAFSALRRMDRFVTAKIFKKPYEFILPGKVKR